MIPPAEMCLCFDECSICLGPHFIMGMLLRKPNTSPRNAKSTKQETMRASAHETIRAERSTMNEKEVGNPTTGAGPVRTLLSWVRQGICTQSGCEPFNAGQTAWDVAQSNKVMFRSGPISDLVLQAARAQPWLK